MDNNLPESQYLAGEREAELADIRNEFQSEFFYVAPEGSEPLAELRERATEWAQTHDLNNPAILFIDEDLGMFDEVIITERNG